MMRWTDKAGLCAEAAVFFKPLELLFRWNRRPKCIVFITIQAPELLGILWGVWNRHQWLIGNHKHHRVHKLHLALEMNDFPYLSQSICLEEKRKCRNYWTMLVLMSWISPRNHRDSAFVQTCQEVWKDNAVKKACISQTAFERKWNSIMLDCQNHYWQLRCFPIYTKNNSENWKNPHLQTTGKAKEHQKWTPLGWTYGPPQPNVVGGF